MLKQRKQETPLLVSALPLRVIRERLARCAPGEDPPRGVFIQTCDLVALHFLNVRRMERGRRIIRLECVTASRIKVDPGHDVDPRLSQAVRQSAGAAE
jgi:hypothetical protein